MSILSDKFLNLCKQAYFEKISPLEGETTKIYNDLIEVAKEYFNKGKEEEFLEFFKEGQYFIPLWAAHLLIEYGSLTKSSFFQSIEIISEYASSPLAPEVAYQEKEWLRKNFTFLKNENY